MICKKCKENIHPLYIRNGTCVFCLFKTNRFDNGEGWLTKETAIIKIKNKDYNKCLNKNTECCILFSACEECYYNILNPLICKYCGREAPNREHLTKDGKFCKWCEI